jgi:glycerophosphoryl diester phosphodiesterase
VVHHDPTVSDLIISRTHRRELPAYVALLDEALEACRGLLVNVEIKNIEHQSEPTYDSTGSFARQVITALHETGWSDSVVTSCFDLATCAIVRSFDPTMEIAWLLWGVEPSKAMIQAHVLGLDAINPHFTVVTEEVIEKASTLELDVNVWTVNNQRDIETMARLGVRSIITDVPVLALSLVGKS